MTVERAGCGAVCGGAIASPRRTLPCWPGPTRTSLVCPGRCGSGAMWATRPSLVVTVVSGTPFTIVTSTTNDVPRTDAVDDVVRTWYFESPITSLLTTCQVRPRFCVISMTVAPPASMEVAFTESELLGSISTVDPSKYVRTARPSSPVSIVSPGPMTSPSTAAVTAPPACRTLTEPPRTVAVVDAQRLPAVRSEH